MSGISNDVIELLRARFQGFEIRTSEVWPVAVLHSTTLGKRGGIRLVGGAWAGQSNSVPCRYFDDPVASAEYALSIRARKAGEP